MYKFYYRRKSNGANVVSHHELNDDDLVLANQIADTAMTTKQIKNTAIKKEEEQSGETKKISNKKVKKIQKSEKNKGKTKK